METNTISITLWGNGQIKGRWLEWYNDVGTIFKELGYKRTHIGMQSKSYVNRKIVTVARKEAQILQLLQAGEKPMSMSCYSLDKEYKQASFDYNIMAVRHSKYLSLILNKSDSKIIDVNSVVVNLKQYIEFECGEIYQMERNEMPLIYAARANPPDAFKSLKVLDKF